MHKWLVRLGILRRTDSRGVPGVVSMVIVGLGNPGAEHAGQRHNIGFDLVDVLALSCNAAPFHNKFRGLVSEIRLDGAKVFLLKPQTYMNLSGRSVSELVAFYKLNPEQVVVIHDDLDLAPGQLKVKKGGGHGGHNGLKSVDAAIGPDYWRVRVGIGHPGHKDRVTPYVLGQWGQDDQAWREDLARAFEKHAALLVRDPQAFGQAVMQECAQKPA